MMTPDGRQPRHAFPRSQVTVKTVLTVSFALLGVVLLVYLATQTMLSIGVVVASTLIAVAIDQGARLLQRHGWKRGWAVAAILGALGAILVGTGWLVIPEAANQIQQLVDRAPQLLQSFRESSLYQTLDQRFGLGQMMGGQFELPSGTLETSLTAVQRVFTWLAVLVSIVFTVIFMLAFGGRLIDALLAEAMPANRQRYERFVREAYRSVGGYIGGLAILAAINAVVNSVVLAVLGIPFFLPLGLISGLGSFIPFVGAITAGVLMGGVGLASGGVLLGLGVVAWYVVYQQIESNVFGPLVYKRTIQINPLIALLVVIFAAELLGIVGAIIAVPAAAVAQIVVRQLLALRREKLALPQDIPVSDAMAAKSGGADGDGRPRSPPPPGPGPHDPPPPDRH